jgi:hypothetical protein
MGDMVFGPQLPHALPTLDTSLSLLLGGDAEPDFLWQAARMPPVSRRLLLEHVDPQRESPEALLDELKLSSDFVSLDAPILRRASALSPEACAALRKLVDNERNDTMDTVDGAPTHQINLSHESLAALVGAATLESLLRLPAELLGGGAPVDTREAKAFVRRYSPDTRPWNPFHVDSYRVTINVALSDEAACVGGRLLALRADGVAVEARAEGTATVHSSTLLHGVSRLARGTRYALIIFVGQPRAWLPAELELDAHAQLAEAAALATLLTEPAVAQAAAALGATELASLIAAHDELLLGRDGAAVGAAIARAVQTYAAPHLKPTSIEERVRGGRAESAIWSLRTLLRYAREDTASLRVGPTRVADRDRSCRVPGV